MGIETGTALLISSIIGAGAAVGTSIASRKRQKKAQTAALSKETTVDTGGAVDTAKDIKKDIKKRRVNLFQTEGGVSGQELSPEQIQKRPTLLGN